MQKNLKSLSYFITVGLMMSLHGCKHTKSGRQSEINPRVEVNTDAPDAAAVSAGGDKQAPAIEAEGMPNPRVPVDLNPPGLPVAQLWSNGAKSFTIHQSIPVKACPEDADDLSSCAADLAFYYERATKTFQFRSCECGVIKKQDLVLQPAQTKEIDRLVQALKLQNGPHITCVEGGPSLELIIQNSEGIEQSFPVAMTACEGGEQSPLDEASFQDLFAVLKKALPAKP